MEVMENWPSELEEKMNAGFLPAAAANYENGSPHCSLCWTTLQDTCFEKSGMVICKVCYARAESKEECYKCKKMILNSEMVMKCDGIFIHWKCFLCSVCDVKLEKGEKYGVMEGQLFCEQHFQDASYVMQREMERQAKQNEDDFLAYFCYSLEQSIFQSNINSINNPDFQMEPFADTNSWYLPMEQSKFGSNVQSDTVVASPASSQSNDTADSQTTGKASVQGDVKRKRHRTTFRQEQLSEMKSVFEQNPNPDTAKLQRLSQKLGLTKRVVQVWFQNARAKQRKSTPFSKAEPTQVS